MENHNIKVGLKGVALRNMLKAQMLEAGLLRLLFETYPIMNYGWKGLRIP